MTKEEFARLVLDSTDSLYRVSKGILRNDSDCEDAVWEAIGIGFARLDTLQHDRYAKTWLIRILIHECCRLLRERKYRANVGTEDLEYRDSVCPERMRRIFPEGKQRRDDRGAVPLYRSV